MKLLLDRAFNQNIGGLQKALDLTWRRNQVIASNIANAETPQYRASDINFGSELDKAFGQNKQTLKLTDPKHLDVSGSASAHLVPDLSGATKADGNNVDLDLQMGQLSFNGSRFSSAARFLRKELSILKYAIREAGR